MFTLLSNWTCDYDFVLTEKERSHKGKLPARIFRENAQSPAALFGEYAEKAARMTPTRDLLLLFGQNFFMIGQSAGEMLRCEKE